MFCCGRLTFRAIFTGVLVGVLLGNLICGFVLADSYNYYLDIVITDTGGTARSYVPIVTGIKGANLNGAGYIDANGLDTQVKEASTARKYMIGSAETPMVVPTLDAYQQRTFRMYLDYTPAQTALPIILGNDGYITVADAAALELANNFQIDISGYVDVSYTATDTLSEYSSDSDAMWVNTDAVYATCQSDAAADNVYDSGNAYWVGQKTGYTIYRVGLYFDTSSIPSTAIIENATIYLWLLTDNSDTDFDIVVQSGMPTYPSDPAVVGDYDESNYSGDGGSVNTSTFSATGQYYALTLDATGEGWINKGGTTKFLLRSQEDIDASAPTGNEYVEFQTTDYTGTSQDPYIEVEYRMPYIVDKDEVFSIYNSAAGEITADINNGTKTVTATGLSSGEMDIRVLADGTDFEIYIDDMGTPEDTVVLSGTSVTDNANDWYINYYNVIPYMDLYKHTVSSTLIAHYEPNTMVTGTTLADREGAAQNGTITWGSNENLTVSIGGIVPDADVVSDLSYVDTIADTVQGAAQPANWFATGTGSNLPFYATFSDKATEMGMPSQSLYVMMMLGVASAVGLGVLVFTGSTLIAAVACGLAIAAGVNTGVLSAWMLFVYGIFSLAIIYLARQQ